MIRSVPSLATLQRQPNNVTCCTSPPDPHTNPAVASLSLRLARNYRPSGTGKSRLKDTIPVLWISFISSARCEHVRAWICLFVREYVWVRSHIHESQTAVSSIREFHVSTRCSVRMIANTTQHRYFSLSSDHVSQFASIPCTMNVRARCPALLQRGSGREKLDNRRLNLHFFPSRLFHNGEMQYPLSRLQYWHTSYANSASLSGQEKSSCGTFQILLCFQLHILNYILIIQRYDRF